MLVGMGRSPSRGHKGWGAAGPGPPRQRPAPHGQGATAGGWHPLPLPAGEVWTGGPKSRPGEGVHRPRMGWCWVQFRDLQQETLREGVKGAAGPSIWSPVPALSSPGSPARLGWAPLPVSTAPLGSQPKATLGARYHVPLPYLCLTPMSALVQGVEQSRT